MSPPIPGPTQKQLRVLRHIAASIRSGRPCPTLRELNKHFGWSAICSSRDHLKGLEKKGLIERDRAKARSVMITAAGWRELGGAQ